MPAVKQKRALPTEVTPTVIRQQENCFNRANSKHFPTKCFVCHKGRGAVQDDECRFEGKSNSNINGAFLNETNLYADANRL